MSYRNHVGKLSCIGFDPFYAIASWLLRRNAWEGWGLVGAGAAIITLVDLLPGNEGINIRSLYVLPVIFGCWMLDRRQAVAVTAFVVVAMSVKALLVQQVDLVPVVTSTLARTVSLAAVAGMVAGFRSSYNHVFHMARRDRMTGALNKAAFEEEARAVFATGSASGATVLLAVMDIDGFKSVNDQHGHDAGDEVLRSFSHSVATEIRRTDRFGRLGGDEFAMALHVASASEARALAAAMHARVSAALAATGYAVTCSMGALIVPPGQIRSGEELMREADQLMYSVKRGGKNAVVVSETRSCQAAAKPAAIREMPPSAARFF